MFIMEEVKGNYQQLMEMAGSTVHRYLKEAKEFIDIQFGEGYAKAHPELVAAFIKVAGDDFNTAVKVKNFQYLIESIDNIARSLSEIAENI